MTQTASNSEKQETVRVQDKMNLKDMLYREDYDRVCIRDDGTWYKTTVGTMSKTAIYRIDRSDYYDMSRRQVDELVKIVECVLNGVGKFEIRGYDTNIQQIWEENVKNA